MGGLEPSKDKEEQHQLKLTALFCRSISDTCPSSLQKLTSQNSV